MYSLSHCYSTVTQVQSACLIQYMCTVSAPARYDRSAAATVHALQFEDTLPPSLPPTLTRSLTRSHSLVPRGPGHVTRSLIRSLTAHWIVQKAR